QPREIVHDIPKSEYRANEDLFDRFFVGQADRTRLSLPRIGSAAHRMDSIHWGSASNLNRLSQPRVADRKLVAVFNNLAERLSAPPFAVGQKDTGARRRKGIEPAQQVRLPRMPAQTAERVDGSTHRDLLAEDGDRFLAVHEHAAQRAVTLVANDKNGRP